MAGNKTIFDLPLRTGITADDRLAIVDSGNTLTSSVKVSDLTGGTGVSSLESLTGDITFSGTNIDISTSGQTIILSGSTGGGGGGTSLIVDGTGTESIKTNSTGNVAANDYSVVLGGTNNSIAGPTTNFGANGIFAGGNNTIGQRSDYSAIAGGNGNSILNSFAWDRDFIAGGSNNSCGGSNSFNLGGNNNYVIGDYGGNIGGQSNTFNYWDTNVIIASDNGVVNNPSGNGVIVGGKFNTIGHVNSVVIGGTSQSTSIDNEVVVPNLTITNYASLNFADDTAAAAGGIILGQVYHNAGALRVRIV